jgi:hypothetical protein
MGPGGKRAEGTSVKMRFCWRVALCRDRGPDGAGPSSIFIYGGEPEMVMGYNYESFIATSDSRP